MSKKVLIVYASAGSGHRRAADAIHREFQLLNEPEVSCHSQVIDAFDYTANGFRLYYRDAYHLLLKKMPWMWANLFALTDSPYMNPARSRPGLWLNGWFGKRLVKLVQREQPDLVVCTHFLPLEILWLARKRGKINTPLHCVITDYYAHELWLLEGVDQYYVGNLAIGRHIARWSRGQTSCEVTGIPISPEFYRTRRSHDLYKRLGLREDLPTVLLLGGALGMSPIRDAYLSLLEIQARCQVIVVAGIDEALRAEMLSLAQSSPVTTQVYGYVSNLHEMLACADIAVTKPGGLTTAECLAKGVIMLLVDPIPGQEERNLEYVIQNGAGRLLYHPADAGHAVSEIISNPMTMQCLHRRAQALGAPGAAHDIVHRLAHSNGNTEKKED